MPNQGHPEGAAFGARQYFELNMQRIFHRMKQSHLICQDARCNYLGGIFPHYADCATVNAQEMLIDEEVLQLQDMPLSEQAHSPAVNDNSEASAVVTGTDK